MSNEEGQQTQTAAGAVRMHLQIDPPAEQAQGNGSSPVPPAYESPRDATVPTGANAGAVASASPDDSPSSLAAARDPDHLAVPARQKGLGLPKPSSMEELTSLRILFENLSWTVRVKNPSSNKAEVKANPMVDKKVLNEVSGVFRPGKFTAVMGSSGAGLDETHNARE